MVQNKNIFAYITAALFFLGLTYIFIALSIFRSECFNFNEHGDMGYFHQLFYVLSETKYKIISFAPHAVNNPHITPHLFPMLYLILPFYILIPSIQTIFTAQFLIIISGSLAVYAICRFFKSTIKTSVTISLCYIFNPYTVSFVFNDFRFLQMGLPFILFAYLFYLQQRIKPFIIAFILACLCREEMAFVFPFFPMLVPKTDQKQKKLMIILPLFLSFFWYVVIYRFFYMEAMSSEYTISPYLTRKWLTAPENHLQFFKETLHVFKFAFFKLQVFFILFALRKPTSLLIIYPFFFAGSILDNPLKNLISPYWFPSIHYLAVPFAFIFIAFILFVVTNKKAYKSLLLGFLLIYSVITSYNDIRFNLFLDEEVTKKEQKEIIDYVETKIGTRDNPNIILAEPFFAPILSKNPKVFLTEAISMGYPDLFTELKKTKFLLINKEKMFPALKDAITKQKHFITETETYYLIEMENDLDINPFLLEPGGHISIYNSFTE